MKNVAFTLLLLTCLWPLRVDADILANSNFTNGNGNWQGDAKDIDSGDLGSSDSNQAGVIITLKKDKWTKIYQLFNVRDKKLYYTVSFQLSNDFKLNSHDMNDYSQADLGDIPGMMFMGTLSESYFTMLIQGGDNWNRAELLPDLSKRGQSQTLSGHVNMSTTDVQSCFLIAIPPGEGSVTFTTISLSNVDPNAQP